MINGQTVRYTIDNVMSELIDKALDAIEDDYKICLQIIGKYFDYLDTCGLKEFNKYSNYKWSYDRDKSNGYSYVCIRYGNSLEKKCLVKKRPYIENEDLYKWVENKDLIHDALDEAYQYIVKKINTVKINIEAMREAAEKFEEKLEGLFDYYDDEKITYKRLGE